MTHAIAQHPVAVVVFVTASGVDERDAARVAEHAVSRALSDAAVDGMLPLNTHGIPHVVTLHGVTEVGSAARNGDLQVTPSARAFSA